MPCILNAANEVAVKAFLKSEIKFTDMPIIAAETMTLTPYIKNVSLDELIATNAEARRIAEDIKNKLKQQLSTRG